MEDFSLYPALTDPRIAQDPFYARMFDRFTPQGDMQLTSDDKKRMFRQGLLQFAAAVSKPNGGNFTNSIASGLLAGSQGMNQGVDDIAKRKYQQSLIANSEQGPAEFRSLDMMARAAGFEPGTEGYQRFMTTKGGLTPRQSSAAIQYKQQMGADGVMRYVAFDPNQVGAEVIGGGGTYGAPVGRPSLPPIGAPQGVQPQFSPPPMQPTGPKDPEAIIAQANQLVQQGMPGDQVDMWVKQQMAQPEVLDASQPDPQMPPQMPTPQAMPQQAMPQPSIPAPQAIPLLRQPSGPSPFRSRPEEQQKALDALAAARATNQAAREQMPYDVTQAGNIEAAKVRGQVGAQSATAGMAATTQGTIEAAKAQATDAAKTFGEIQQTAKIARTENNNLKMLRASLQNTYTGTGANAVLGAKRVAAAVGIKVDGLGDAEAARALANKMALALRNPAGGEGMPGAMSDADRIFLQQSTPGLQSSPAGWKAMVNMRLALNQYAIDQAQYAERLRLSGVPVQDIPGRLQQWADQHQIFHPKQTHAAPQASGWGIQKVGN